MRDAKKRNFQRLKQVLISMGIACVILAVLVFVTYGRDIPVIETKGLIANQQRDLIILVFGLGLVVIIPVFILLFSIAWKYRAGNTKAKYEPELEGSKGLEALWWGIPCAIILLLGIITAVSTHALDPYKPISSSVKPVEVQVISLNWKWLFIYPDQGVATLNYMNIPKDTPINLTITSDAPMNSFWVPALAGQVYSMSGMSTKLHLMADSTGTYNGVSANISGEGYADMTFKVNSMNETDFTTWAKSSYDSNSIPLLTKDSYDKLAESHINKEQITYLLMDTNLYNEVIMKYMSHGESASTEKAHGMNM